MRTSQPKAGTAARKRASYKHSFVDIMPDKLDEGTLYVCMQYATSAHNCFCACGREVVTPIHPTKWKLTFDGISVSLFPSIGNWSLGCKSHYWLQDGRIMWAESWSDEEIQAVRARDLAAQDSYFGKARVPPQAEKVGAQRSASLWRKVANWFQGE